MLQLNNIKKSYKTSDFTQTALDGVSIAFRDNEFAAVLGPSGSGKTTMLNIIGGLDRYDSGELEIDQIPTKKYKARDWDAYRNNRIGFVFQSYNLIPHQTVLANVELALTLSGVPKAERLARAKRALEEVGLEQHMQKKPNQLSGGQMQRVAIARALINDPEILLADEPTGALDTHTSRQVMDLLTKIAKDRLVIMVTHNSELAQRYANRIIHLTDGQVVSDSRPFDPSKEEKRTGRETRKTSMSFLTAIALSFSNLMTKKGRTFVTSLAGSIGIIGIAAILALATGINAYIKNIEEDTLSIYPLTIQSSGFDLTSMLEGPNGGGQGNATSENPDSVRERRIIETMFSYRSNNDLASLKSYLGENHDEIDPYVTAIQYAYDITPQIYLADTSKGVDQVYPDSILSDYGLNASGSGSISSLTGLSGMPSMNVFSEMPNEVKLYENQYNVLAGRWPENYDEVVLVLSQGGRISDYELYAMGLRDRSELRAMVEALMNKTETNIEMDENSNSYSYDTLMSVEFKVISPADKYQYDETYGVWVDKSSDRVYMKSLVNQSLSLKIVGIVRPDSDASVTSLSSGINYTSGLIQYLMEQAAAAQTVKDQIANPAINVLTGKTFDEEKENSSTFDFSKIISIDEQALKNAFNFDLSSLGLDLSDLDLSLDLANIELPDMDIGELTAAIAAQINIPADQIVNIMGAVLQDFLLEEAANGVTDPNQIAADLITYLARPEVQALLAGQISQVVDVSQIQTQITEALQNYMQAAMQTYINQIMDTVMAQIQQAMQKTMAQLPAQMQNIDRDAFAKAFKINMDEEGILELMLSIMNPTESTYERNLSILGYADPNVPSEIKIYPRNFESKQEVINFLDRYNAQMEANGEAKKVVRYTDIVGVLMSSVTDIVDMVSYALIAFVAISLVVSSIMIGVITYISVLERKKEIGVLRAVGASKQDIRRVFNAETLIVGFIAGVLGILVTLLICVIANVIIFNKFGIAQIAQLPAAAFILIAVSMFLTFIAGLFPSSAAARKDPVEALRSE